MRLLTEQEKMALSADLDKLFALQDRPLSQDKRSFIIDEMEKIDIPVAAWMAGIRSLITEDLKSIKIGTLIGAAKRCMEPQDVKNAECVWCDGVGVMSMKDEVKRSYALACRCVNGERFPKSVRWNGEEKQFSNGRMLTTFLPLDVINPRRKEAVPF